ncbi:MAG: DUF1080 domain-containing protein [Planctomycetes bacterium]|nr:DUF1080 domain-containing protein [Planctomycetota bacterium]
MSRKLLQVACFALLSASLSAQSDEFGEWIDLFSGKDLTGWQNAKPDEEHHRGPNRWAAADGALTNTKWGGEGNDVCTERTFKDYELEVEYKIPKDGNSGVYLRGQIEIQIFDSFGKEKLSMADAGAIYGAGFLPLKNVQKAAGEWNQFRVLHIGHRITVWHNGVLIQDNVFQSGQTGGSMKTHKGRELTTDEGPLMFQGDHSQVWYRNIRIRPLLAGGGWKSLWNGEDLTQFDGHGRDKLLWEVRDNAFTNTATGGGGHDIWTKESLGNFLAYYCYKSDSREEDSEGRKISDRSGNSGFYLRNQWEIQVLSHQEADPENKRGKHSDGALYSLYAPLVKARHEPDQWNHMFVKVDGMKIWIWQNGKLIHDGRVCETRTDNHGQKTLEFSKGPFKLQGDHGKVWFSGVHVKPLPDDR